MQRIPIRPAISMYLGIGIFLTSIRFMSLFAWAGWHLLFPAVDMNGNSISYLGTCIVALKGTALMLVGWPIYIYWAIKGPATWGAVFFYPWFALAR